MVADPSMLKEPERILVVDDHTEIRDALCAALQYGGYEVHYINFDTWPGAVTKRRTTGGKGKGKGKGSSLNSDYVLSSMGKNGMSAPALTDDVSMDDIIRADDGGYTSLASEH